MKYIDKMNLLCKEEWKALESEMNLTYTEDIVIEAERSAFSGGVWLSFYLVDEENSIEYLFGFTVSKRDFYIENNEYYLTYEAYRAICGYKEALIYGRQYKNLCKYMGE